MADNIVVGQQRGLNPLGETVVLPVGGEAASTSSLLGPGEVWRSGIKAYNGVDAVLFALSSDVPGFYQVEYYRNGEKLNFMGIVTPFDPSVVSAFQGALAGKGDSFQLVYTNGPQAQSQFFCEIRFSDNVQETLRSMGAVHSRTNLGSMAHVVVEGDLADGSIGQATLTKVGDAVAQNFYLSGSAQPLEVTGNLSVNMGDEPLAVTGDFYPQTQDIAGEVRVANLPTDYLKAANLTGLAQNSTLKDGSAKFQVTNPTPAVDVSALAKDATLRNGSAKFEVTNPTAPTDVSLLAKDSTLQSVITALSGILKVDIQDTDYAKDSTGQAANVLLTAIRDKLIVSPATETTLAAIRTLLQGSLAVTGALTDTQLRNTPVAVSGTFFQATQPISAAALPLPANASTAGNQTTGNNSLASIDGKTPALGQALMAASVPVTIASNQTAVPVSIATAVLPTNAATESTLALIRAGIDAINLEQGAVTDAQATNSTGSWSEIALLKGLMQRPANSTISSVTTLATSTQILAANPLRKGASIFSVTGTILISLGSQNSATLFTSRIITNAAYEVPYGYTGAVFATGAGTVTVTELT